jgi:transmembrane sensor
MAGDSGTPKHHPRVKTADGGNSQLYIVLALVAVVGGGGIWYLNRAGEDNKLNSLFNSQETRKINTGNGQSGNVTLSDGTALTIAPATRLTIIPDYNKVYRGIKVEGGLKLDVKSSANTPLEIRAGGAALVIDEGSVVARAYGDEGDAYIKLASGSAELRAKEVRRQLTGPVAVHIAKDSAVHDIDAATADAATAFADGKVVFNATPLKDVLPLFNKYYALNMEVADQALLTRPVTMEAMLDSKQKALDALQASAFVKFGYDGSKPMLRDDPAAAAKAAKKK